MWKCQCNCEEHTIVVVQGSDLKYGHIKSCGCLNREATKKYNEYKLNICDEHGLYGIGFCINTGNEFYFDMNDYDKIKDYCWVEDIHKGYHSLKAWNIDTGGNIIMAQLLFGKYYDHADRNPLNNRKYNLRKATNSQNTANREIMKNNTSGITGVNFDKKHNRWVARIQIGKIRIPLGRYVNKEDAIIARLKAEKRYFREFAPQKHLYEQYGIAEEDNNDGTTD